MTTALRNSFVILQVLHDQGKEFSAQQREGAVFLGHIAKCVEQVTVLHMEKPDIGAIIESLIMLLVKGYHTKG